MVEALLTAGADANRAGPGGESPLHTAARTGVPGPVKALLKAGAKPNTEPERPTHQTALMWAASEGHTEVVELLIAAGANLHAQLASGFNAWLFAVRAGRTETVRALLKAGVDVNYATPAGPKPKGKVPVAGTTALRPSPESAA